MARAPRGFKSALAFLAPVLTVHLAHYVNSAADPQLLFAAEEAELAGLAVAAPVRPDDVQRGAWARVLELRASVPGASPFIALETEGTEMPELAEPLSPHQPRVTPPAIALSSVLRRADGQVLAVINGRLTGVNAEVAPGWVVRDIDASARRVRIEHTSGAAYLYSFGSRDDEAGSGGSVSVDEVSDGGTTPAPASDGSS